MLNWALLKNPLNWATVILMLLIAVIGFHQFTKYVSNSSIHD